MEEEGRGQMVPSLTGPDRSYIIPKCNGKSLKILKQKDGMIHYAALGIL